MSEQERREIVGQAVLEHQTLKRNLAALQAKALSYSRHMKAVLSALPEAKAIPVDDIERCPGSADLMSLFGEIQDTRARIEEIAKVLREMGIAL